MGTLKVSLIGEDETVKRCPFCGWPEDELYEEASRHRTSEGQTVWTRCVCGSLQMRIAGSSGTRVVARSRGNEHLVADSATCDLGS